MIFEAPKIVVYFLLKWSLSGCSRSAFHTTHIMCTHVPTDKTRWRSPGRLQGSLGDNLAMCRTGGGSRLGWILNHVAVGGEGTLYPKIAFLPNWQGRASSWFIRFEEVNQSDMCHTPGLLGKELQAAAFISWLISTYVSSLLRGMKSLVRPTASHLPPCLCAPHKFCPLHFRPYFFYDLKYDK